MTEYSLTRNELMEKALRMAQRIGEEDSPTVKQYQEAGNVINMIHSEMMNSMTPLIQLELKSKSVSTVSFSLDAEDDDIYLLYKSETADDDPPMRRLSYNEYYGDISDKTDTGEPVSYYPDFQSTRTVYLYPVPDAAMTIKYLALKKFSELKSSTTIPLDNRYYLYLMYKAAQILYDLNGGNDPYIGNRISKRVEEYESRLKSRERNRQPSFRKGTYQ
jgi:hypothetical protein